jgi:hypothetical protein
MKNSVFFMVLCLVLTNSVYGQINGIKYYTNCNGNKNYYALNGDTVVFKCDSIRLINNTAFNTLQTAYTNLYTTSNQLILKTDSASLVFKNLYEQKAKDYEALYLQFSEFNTNTQNHIAATDTNIMAIRNYTNIAKIELNKADSAIVAGINKINDYEKHKKWTLIKYTSIGFLIGILSSLAFVFIK